MLEGDCGVANARQENHPDCALRLALASDQLGITRKFKWGELLGDIPALLKGFLEQVARPGFAFGREGGNPLANKGLTGRSARIVVTMGMPAAIYRWYFRAHSIKSLERNILGFVGIAPVNETLIGMAGNMEPEPVKKWLTKLKNSVNSAIKLRFERTVHE